MLSGSAKRKKAERSAAVTRVSAYSVIQFRYPVRRAVEGRPRRVPRRIDLELGSPLREGRSLSRSRAGYTASGGNERERRALLDLEINDVGLEAVPSMELNAVVQILAGIELHLAVFPFPFRRPYFQRGEVFLVTAPSLRAHQHEKIRFLAASLYPRPERDAISFTGHEVFGRQRIPPPTKLVRNGGAIQMKCAAGIDTRKIMANYLNRTTHGTDGEGDSHKNDHLKIHGNRYDARADEANSVATMFHCYIAAASAAPNAEHLTSVAPSICRAKS